MEKQKTIISPTLCKEKRKDTRIDANKQTLS